ncbi:MAG: PDZ domain-containing protein [Candidatus Moranbacteria bacterium]|nr:PDZ domain-containing protein [Candidatus Moranbacteria bacterium]
MSISKKISLAAIVILLSGISGITADRFIFPHLQSTDFFSKSKFLSSLSDDVTVINKTEQVYIKEESSLNKIASQSASSVVNIAYFPDPDRKAVTQAKNQQQAPFPKNRTGVIVTSDGMIMTYLNETDPKSFKYVVLTGDGNSYDATLLDVDSYSNLAFLKIEAANLPVVSFGNSDDAKAGEKIVTIGNSFGEYGNSFASGILRDFNPAFNIAGKSISSSEKLEGVFESDIDNLEIFIGGPVVDYSSQVIGINGETQIDGKTVSFQIPSNKVRTIIDKEIRKDIANNADLGIYYVPITKTYALANRLKVTAGALIYSASGQQGLAIIADSPADKAGLRMGDIITAVSGEKIASGKSLSDIIYGHKTGDRIELTLIRNGEEMTVPITL